MSQAQNLLSQIQQAYLEFSLPLTKVNEFKGSLLNTIESSPELQVPSPKDWMTSVLTFENINKIGLLNVMKVRSALQISHQNLGYDSCVHLALKALKNEHEKVKQRIDNNSDEEDSIRKKVKIESEDLNTKTEPVPPLSNLVDEQLMKLPKCVSEKIQDLLSQKNLTKSSKTISSPVSNSQSPKQDSKSSRIIAFKFDPKRQIFIYVVERLEKSDSNKPKISFLTREEIMKIDPGMIVSYYEEQIAKNFQSNAFSDEMK